MESETTNINSLPNKYLDSNMEEPVKRTNEIYNNVHLETSEIPNNMGLNTEKITHDNNSKVNFVPESENDVYYIPQEKVEEKAIKKSESLFDFINNISIEEIKMSLIIGLTYIILLLPTTQNIIKNMFIFSYEEDKLTLNGIYLLGCIFSILYLIMIKLVDVIKF